MPAWSPEFAAGLVEEAGAHIGTVVGIPGSDSESEGTVELDKPDWPCLGVSGCRRAVWEHRRDWVARQCWGTGWG